VLIASTVMTISLVNGDGSEGATPRKGATNLPTPTATTHTGEAGGAVEQPGIPRGELDAELARLRATPDVTSDSALPRITGDATLQPDLYAAEFTRRLLNQDYGKSRTTWLSWVQSESARTEEPLVVGLVPRELRDRWAVFTVTDPTDGGAPIPTAEEWAHLAQQAGKATGRVLRVSEPMAWTNAVEAGRVTDPGITARIVSAEVILTTVVDGRTHHQVTSVELGLEFEGPPTRDAWGFVGAVTYTAMPLGSS
jgi:hypothetical protein